MPIQQMQLLSSLHRRPVAGSIYFIYNILRRYFIYMIW
jgi:hypothetical protein